MRPSNGLGKPWAVARIKYHSLARYLESIGHLEVEERGDEIVVSMVTPTRSDAAGVQGVDGERGIYRLVFRRRGDEVELVDAWVEVGDEKRHIDISDLEHWLRFVETW